MRSRASGTLPQRESHLLATHLSFGVRMPIHRADAVLPNLRKLRTGRAFAMIAGPCTGNGHAGQTDLCADSGRCAAGAGPESSVLARLRTMATAAISAAITAATSAPAALRSALGHAEPPAETGTPARPRLVFAVDATASREPAWAAARQVTDALVQALPGELDVALAVHGDSEVFSRGPLQSGHPARPAGHP